MEKAGSIDKWRKPISTKENLAKAQTFIGYCCKKRRKVWLQKHLYRYWHERICRYWSNHLWHERIEGNTNVDGTISLEYSVPNFILTLHFGAFQSKSTTSWPYTDGTLPSPALPHLWWCFASLGETNRLRYQRTRDIYRQISSIKIATVRLPKISIRCHYCGRYADGTGSCSSGPIFVCKVVAINVDRCALLAKNCFGLQRRTFFL